MPKQEAATKQALVELRDLVSEADASKNEAEQCELTMLRKIDSLRRDGVAWREILFAVCRARGLPSAQAGVLAVGMRKRLHDYRRLRGSLLSNDVGELRYRSVEETVSMSDRVLVGNGKRRWPTGAEHWMRASSFEEDDNAHDRSDARER